MNGLRQSIRSGQYPAGTWLPPERDVAAQFGVTRRAVRRAIALLAEEGLIRCQPRFRPIVLASPSPSDSMPTASPSLIPASPAALTGAGSRLVALVMWHGESETQSVSAQQRVFWGMNQRLARDGYHGIFLNLGDTVRSEGENADREAAHLRYVQEQGFAGVIFYAYAYRRNRELIQETASKMPLVLIDRMIPGIQSDFVGINNQAAMYTATRHLIDLGHRRILFAATAEAINTVQDRWEGYQQAMSEAPGGPLPENILTVPARPSLTEWPVFDSLFGLSPERRPTAVVCVNDYVALDIYRHLRGLGMSVPQDVALCGFDDIVPVLPSGIGLTSVSQPFEEIGRAAAEVFLERRSGSSVAGSALKSIELQARLVVRESTADALVNGTDASQGEPKSEAVQK
ncbi:MAG: GntR family transcriptional regulator [Armatimonadota bacterium]